MPHVKAKAMREMTADEIRMRLQELREELFNLRFQHAAGQLENTGRLCQVRHDIARIMTVQSSRERSREF